jgi:hypothetical protein
MGIYLKQERSIINQIIKNMPRFDGRGPSGFGPMTGRGMGYCGCGPRFQGRSFLSKKEEAEILEEEAQALKEELDAVKERLTEIKEVK